MASASLPGVPCRVRALVRRSICRILSQTNARIRTISANVNKQLCEPGRGEVDNREGKGGSQGCDVKWGKEGGEKRVRVQCTAEGLVACVVTCELLKGEREGKLELVADSHFWTR